MTKAELIASVARERHMTKKDVDALLTLAFGTIERTTRNTGRFSWPDFGTWSLRARKARNVRNPQTDEIMKLPESRTLGFRASINVRRRLTTAARIRGT